ncbi:hypothetical protein FRC12_009158 [Ceratobasidium sp. 428]|nr:hypothetical protein FRC12_009158 [Ceratobasidium sp. 428]
MRTGNKSKILFTRGLRPFHQVPKPSTERTYWETMCSVPAAELLAHLGVILTSVLPNSMAEEPSMSTITKLNSPDCAAQKVSTLVDMVAIQQHYKREETQTTQSSRIFRPTVKFVDLSQTAPPADCSNESPEMNSSGVSAVLEHWDTELTPRDAELEVSLVAMGSLHHFEAELSDEVSLSSKLLLGLISDRSSISVKRSSSPEPFVIDAQPPQKRQPVDVSTVGY